MISSDYLQDKVNYIEKESAQHGGKTLFVIGEIQRAQMDLLLLDNTKFFSQQHEPTKNPIIMLKRFMHDLWVKTNHHIEKYQINQTIRYIKKMYWLNDIQIQDIESSFAAMSSWE